MQVLLVSIAIFYVLMSYGVAADEFTGPVVSVFDGDTIEVLHNDRSERIRLISECLASLTRSQARTIS